MALPKCSYLSFKIFHPIQVSTSTENLECLAAEMLKRHLHIDWESLNLSCLPVQGCGSRPARAPLRCSGHPAELQGKYELLVFSFSFDARTHHRIPFGQTTFAATRRRWQTEWANCRKEVLCTSQTTIFLDLGLTRTHENPRYPYLIKIKLFSILVWPELHARRKARRCVSYNCQRHLYHVMWCCMSTRKEFSFTHSRHLPGKASPVQRSQERKL